MTGYLIRDSQGYFVKRRRVDGRIVDLWSPKLADAAVMHFREVAFKLASTMPQSVKVEPA